MVTSHIRLGLGKKRITMLTRKTLNNRVVGKKVEGLKLLLGNQFAVLTESNDLESATSHSTKRSFIQH